MSRHRIQTLIEHGGHVRWEITLPDDDQRPAICETLDDARKIAYLHAAHPRREAKPVSIARHPRRRLTVALARLRGRR